VDATTFTLADGLSWFDLAGRTRTQTELAEWGRERAGAVAWRRVLSCWTTGLMTMPAPDPTRSRTEFVAHGAVLKPRAD
jgi:hypothetical protein